MQCKWLFPARRLSCLQVHFVTLPWVLGHLCQLAHEAFKGKKLRTEVYMGPHRPILCLWNTTDHSPL